MTCSYRHRAWSKVCGKPATDPVHYEPGGEMRPPYAAYSGPVRHPFNASAEWDPWFGEPPTSTQEEPPAMTDQQTSRTNTIEALRCDVCYGFDPPRDPKWRDNTTKTCDWCEARIQDRIEAFAQSRAAAEPSSDAVTAPDEPSTEAGRRLVADLRDQADADTDNFQAPQAKAAYRAAARTVEVGLVQVEREARAASASAPPLDAIEAAILAQPRFDHTMTIGSEDEDVSAGMEPSPDGLWVQVLPLLTAVRVAYAAETPEQGR